MGRDYAAFAEITKALYGDALDPRELWDLSKANDPSEVHIDGTGEKKKGGGHSKVGAALLIGTAAEGDAAYSAGRTAVDAVKRTGTMARAARGARAAAVGRGALQATNLGIGLVAARELMKKPKPVPAPTKSDVAKARIPRTPRPKVVRMSPADRGDWKKFAEQQGRLGARVLAGTGVAGGLALGHHVGVKRGVKLATAPEPEPVTKAFRVKPLNATDQRRVVSLKARPRPMSPPLAKSAGDFSWSGTISKVDADKRQVFGWCSLSAVEGKPVVDLQGDWVPLEEVEKSAYQYVIHSRKGGDMHKRVSKSERDEPLHTADLIESFVVTPDKLRGMGLAEDALPHGWWVGFKVNDEEQWAKVKTGERAGFSIHGTGHRRALEAA